MYSKGCCWAHWSFTRMFVCLHSREVDEAWFFTAWYQLPCGLTWAWLCSQGLKSRQARAFPVTATDTQERGMPTCPETLNTSPLALIVSHLFYPVAETVSPVWGQVSPGRACELGLHSDRKSGAPAEPGCTRRQRIAFTWYCTSALACGLNVS